MDRIKLPIIICGEIVETAKDYHVFRYGNSVELTIPKINSKHINKIREQRFMLNNHNVQEIISALVKVGRFWRTETQNRIYLSAVDTLCRVKGYDSKMAIRELNIIGSTCAQIAGLYDLLDLELGNRFYIDEWLPRGDVFVHAQPMGNALNIVAGNVPVSSIMSIIRCLLTKNQAIAKFSQKDPVTLIYFAQSLNYLLPENIVTKNLSVLYWEGGDEIEQSVYDMSDVVCAWGRGSSINEIRSKIGAHTRFLEFGPKVSYALIGKESIDDMQVAIDLAHDISLYNQQACFSPQVVFVEGKTDLFVKRLEQALSLYNDLLPIGSRDIDTEFDIMRVKKMAQFEGLKIQCGDNNGWMIISIDRVERIYESPLNRVIYVMSIKSFDECLDYVSPSTQVLSISPWDRNKEIREEATLKGVSKITEIGLIESVRNGATHDDIYPMHEMVRWVCVERGKDYWGKFIEDGPLDTTKWLMQNRNQIEKISLVM